MLCVKLKYKIIKKFDSIHKTNVKLILFMSSLRAKRSEAIHSLLKNRQAIFIFRHSFSSLFLKNYSFFQRKILSLPLALEQMSAR